MKDFFGCEYPTYTERQALAKAAALCIEAGEVTKEAVAMLDEADNDRLYTFLTDNGFIVYRGSDQPSWRANVMTLIVKAVFHDNSDIVEEVGYVDELEYEDIRSFLESVDRRLGGKNLPGVFFTLCHGHDVHAEKVIMRRGTGEIVSKEKYVMSGHDAVRRAAIVAQIVINMKDPQYMGEYMDYFASKAEEEQYACTEC